MANLYFNIVAMSAAEHFNAVSNNISLNNKKTQILKIKNHCDKIAALITSELAVV